MSQFVLPERRQRVGLVTFNRLQVQNARHRRCGKRSCLPWTNSRPIRDRCVMTRPGTRRSAPDKTSIRPSPAPPERAEEWVHECERLYDTMRPLSTPPARSGRLYSDPRRCRWGDKITSPLQGSGLGLVYWAEKFGLAVPVQGEEG